MQLDTCKNLLLPQILVLTFLWFYYIFYLFVSSRWYFNSFNFLSFKFLGICIDEGLTWKSVTFARKSLSPLV